ncbi:glutathione peroxidase [Neomegalonema sp.]|uniref:glutathione peroxidase n=1 Tax=Neomegalonema sp. TaxID=2039713 RepID=UPI00260E151C|nr:glutathione peroxidase [Neomegalonema sp.]MDD2868218.1 glutathione peroxidase [Neomegalonema sp.]
MTALAEIPLTRIDGAQDSLSAHAGKALLIVNVASKCGFTKQYAGLEALHAARAAQGFEVLGFPANDFGGQEPGTEAEIAGFCSATYGVTFPMFAKIVATGPEKHPLYAALTRALPEALDGEATAANLARYGIKPGAPGEVLWNFEKFLVGRDGVPLARFASGVTPEDPRLLAALDAALG